MSHGRAGALPRLDRRGVEVARFKVYVTTDLVNSRVEREFEIDDGELEGLSPAERDALIHEAAQEEAYHLYEWGYEPADAQD